MSNQDPNISDRDELERTGDELSASRPGVPRRHLFTGMAAAAAGLAAAACGDDNDDSTTATTGTGTAATTAGGATTSGADTTGGSDTTSAPDTTAGPTTTASGGGGDLAIGAAAAGLEVLAVNTYTAAGQAATSGALGEVPPAVTEFVTTALSHHQAALDAWNAVLEGAGEPEVTNPPAELAATVEQQLGAVTDVAGAAELALMLEQTAAATYLDVLPTLESEAAIMLAGSILPIAMQHAAVLLFVLGRYPVPDVFGKTDLSIAS